MWTECVQGPRPFLHSFLLWFLVYPFVDFPTALLYTLPPGAQGSKNHGGTPYSVTHDTVVTCLNMKPEKKKAFQAELMLNILWLISYCDLLWGELQSPADQISRKQYVGILFCSPGLRVHKG